MVEALVGFYKLGISLCEFSFGLEQSGYHHRREQCRAAYNHQDEQDIENKQHAGDLPGGMAHGF